MSCRPHHAEGRAPPGAGRAAGWGSGWPRRAWRAVTFYYHYSFWGSSVQSLEQQKPFGASTVTAPALGARLAAWRQRKAPKQDGNRLLEKFLPQLPIWMKWTFHVPSILEGRTFGHKPHIGKEGLAGNWIFRSQGAWPEVRAVRLSELLNTDVTLLCSVLTV